MKAESKSMKTVFEPETMTDWERRSIDKIATELLTKEPEMRRTAAEIVRQHGLEAYVGGHHIAIHRQSFHPVRMGKRLALVTHDAPDWS